VRVQDGISGDYNAAVGNVAKCRFDVLL